MTGTPQPETETPAKHGISDNSSSRRKNHNNEQEWWLPSFPRWPFKSWMEIFAFGPRNDLIGILANKVVDGIHKNLDPDGPLIQQLLEQHLPKDQVSVRTKLPFYESTVDALKYQRDNYLLGTSYANKRQVHLDRAKRLFPPSQRFSAPGGPRMPRDATALGYSQIVNLGSWFVPSETIMEALLPIVISLPSGVLKETITSTVANAIPLAQPLLDVAMKNAVMGVIQDPQIRQMIKSRTQKILRIDENENDLDGRSKITTGDTKGTKD